MPVRDYRRQIYQVQMLSVTPARPEGFEPYTMTRFEVREVGQAVQVIREYGLKNLSYHHSTIVGPRGGRRFDNFSTNF